MNSPLELLYSWQAILVAFACSGLTQFVVTCIDVRIGKEQRKRNVVLTRFVCPMLPIVIGFCFAAAIPIWPEALREYVETVVGADSAMRYVIYGSWGAACGQVADHVRTKARRALGDMRRAEG